MTVKESDGQHSVLAWFEGSYVIVAPHCSARIEGGPESFGSYPDATAEGRLRWAARLRLERLGRDCPCRSH